MSKRKDDNELVQLATRVPRWLLKEAKVYCVKDDVSVMDFVQEALKDAIAKRTKAVA